MYQLFPLLRVGETTNSKRAKVFCLGTIAQQLNQTIHFDRKNKKITNNKLANKLLKGHPPRKGWEEFYKMA